jgi:hypothetical protein
MGSDPQVTSEPQPAAAEAAVDVAYLAEGKLYLAAPGRKPQVIDSHFAQEMLDRQERNRQRHDWKQSGMAWNITRIPGMPVPDQAARPIRFACVSRAKEGSGELAYALLTDVVGGLFYWERKTGYERRLFHRADFHAQDLACHPADGTIAVSVRTEDGAANLALMKPDGKGLREVTAGDSTDECPAWLPGNSKSLVYQSAGLGRGAHGHVIERGPYAVLQLDTDTGEMKTLLESDANDYLAPRVGPDGSLYYITRPYQSLHTPVSPLKVAKDIVLFPFRLVLAIVHFLDYFSMVFRRKPLLTAGGPPKEGPDARYMMLWGKMVDAEQIHREHKAGRGDGVALVPKTWTLHRRRPDGIDEAIASHVVNYDLCPDGGIVYTNGAAIYHLDAAGRRTEICTSRLIERIVRL